MAQLVITEKTAKEIYPTAPDSVKKILEETFTTEQLSGKITDRIKTFKDACKATGKCIPEDDYSSPDEYAYAQLKVIVSALNEGWKPDWNNQNQYKWYPWFYMDDERGFQFDFAYFYSQLSDVCSRLCFKNRELAEYAASQFLDIYKSFFTA